MGSVGRCELILVAAPSRARESGEILPGCKENKFASLIPLVSSSNSHARECASSIIERLPSGAQEIFGKPPISTISAEQGGRPGRDNPLVARSARSQAPVQSVARRSRKLHVASAFLPSHCCAWSGRRTVTFRRVSEAWKFAATRNDWPLASSWRRNAYNQ